MSERSRGLIVDLGVSEGNDTAFYLAKGFQVVAVEADPKMVSHLRQRFAAEIESGDVRLLPFAAGMRFGDSIEFHAHAEHQGVSGSIKRGEVDQDKYTTYTVPVIDYHTIVAQAGVPRYLKMDIEMAEDAFINGMFGAPELPEFVSVECHRIQPVNLLHQLGYTRFRFIDQNPDGGLRLPPRQWEGETLSDYSFVHASGPFGLDVFGNGPWLDYDDLCRIWEESIPLTARTWFDCHAWKPA